MQDFLLSGLVIVGFTLLLVSGIRKLIPSAAGGSAIQGGWLVLLVGSAVGVGLSFLAAYLELLIAHTAMLVWWALVVRGAGAAALAFGYANYRQWVIAQLPKAEGGAGGNVMVGPAMSSTEVPPLSAPSPSGDTPITVPDLILPPGLK